MSSTERLFVAQELAEEHRDALHRRLSLPAGWRMVPPINWHLTLYFVGSVPLDSWRDRCDQLEDLAVGHPPFTLADGSLKVVSGRDDMIWVRFSPHPAFDALHHDLARAFGRPPDPRFPHWPHITLARARHGEGPSLADHDMPGTMRVDELTLYRSEPAQGHPRYVPLARFPLQKSSS